MTRSTHNANVKPVKLHYNRSRQGVKNLSQHQIEQIRALYKTLPMTEVAAQLGYAVGTVFRYTKGTTTRVNGRRPISYALVKAIHRMRVGELTIQKIAEYLGLSMPTVLKYASSVPNYRRNDRSVTTHRRTGLQAD